MSATLERTRFWSDEQVTLMLDMMYRGCAPFQIKNAVNKLPGIVLNSTRGVEDKMRAMRREIEAALAARTDLQDGHPADASAGADLCRLLAVSSLTSPPVHPALAAPFVQGAIKVSYEGARKWAISHGLIDRRFGLNLNAVNEARRILRLPKFLLEDVI